MSRLVDEHETSTILYGGSAYDYEMVVILDGPAVAQDECMVVVQDECTVVVRDGQVVVRGVLVVAYGGRGMIPPLDLVKEQTRPRLDTSSVLKEEQTRLRPDTNSAQELHAEGGRGVIPPLDLVKEEQVRPRLDISSAQEVYAVEMGIPAPSAPHPPVVSLVPLGHFP